MRTKNTITSEDFGYTLAFTDEHLFNLFLDYTKGSTIDEMRGQDKPMSAYEYYIKNDTSVDSKALTIRIANRFGTQNVIGKFFLETDLDLPDNFATEYFIPEYKQPVMGPGNPEDYGRGVGKLMLGRQGKGTVPQEIISKLQLREDPKIVEAFIQKAHQELLTKFQILFAKDAWSIVLAYFPHEDNVQMVKTAISESKLSFLAPQLQTPKEDIALLQSVLTPLIRNPMEWKTMYKGSIPLSIEIGINKLSKRPALATRGKAGFLIMLDQNNKLVVMDKSNKYAVLDPTRAFVQIREFASLVKSHLEASKGTSNKKDDTCLVM
jgi:hypothetical protein